MRMLSNKRGIELPISMLVILIISLIVFSFALVMVFKFFKGATEASAQIDRATQEQIMAVLREGNDIVALPKNNVQARVGERVTFGLGIRNIDSTDTFSVSLGFEAAYAPDETRFSVDQITVERDWLGNFKQQKDIRIEHDNFITIPVILRVGTYTIDQQQRTQHGNYVFNVCVFKESKCPLTDCKIENKKCTYDEKIHQITINV